MRIATRLSLLIAGAICIVILIGGTSFVSVSELIKANKLVSHSRIVLQELNLLLYNLSDTVGTQRVYIITGQEIYLNAYHALIASTNESIEKISQLVADNPKQSFRASKLNALIKERLASLETTVKLYKDKGKEAAFNRIRTGKSLQFRIALHESIDEMKQCEIDLLQAREQEMQTSASATQLTIVSGVCLGLAISVLFGYLFAKYVLNCIRQLIRAADNIRYGRFDLSTSINSDDEFAELAGAFDTVGQQLLMVSKKLTEQEKVAQENAQTSKQLTAEVDKLQEKLFALGQLTSDEQMVLLNQEENASQLIEIFANLIDIGIQLERVARNNHELTYRIGHTRERAEEKVTSLLDDISSRKSDNLSHDKFLVENIQAELSRESDLYRELSDNGLEVVVQNYLKLVNSKKQLSDKIAKNVSDIRQSIDKRQSLFKIKT